MSGSPVGWNSPVLAPRGSGQHPRGPPCVTTATQNPLGRRSLCTGGGKWTGENSLYPKGLMITVADAGAFPLYRLHSVILGPSLEMRKQKHRWVKGLVQGHTA